MKVVSKIGVGVAIVAVAGLGSVYFVAKSTSDAIETEISNNLNVAQSVLGSDVKIERLEQNSGLFETSGKIKISRQTKDSKLSGGAIVNYNIEHGLMAAFGGEAKISGDITPDGEILKTLQIKSENGVTQTFTGVIKDGEELEVIVKHNNISLVIPESLLSESDANKDGMTIKANGEIDTIKYNSKTKDLLAEYKGLNLSLEDAKKPIDKINIKNISGSHQFNVDKVLSSGIYQGQSAFRLEQLDNGTEQFKLVNFKIETDSNIENNKYNFISKIKVGSFTGLGQVNISGELNTSLRNINKEMILSTKELVKNINKDATISDEFANKYKAVMTKGIEDGMVVSIDSLKIKGDNIDIDGAAAIKVTPASPDIKFSLYKNASIDLRTTVKGALAQTASAVIGSTFGLEIPDPNQPINEFKFSIGYSDGVVKVNEITAKPDVSLIIEDSVKAADNMIGYTVEDVKPETIQQETIKTTEEKVEPVVSAPQEEIKNEPKKEDIKDDSVAQEKKPETKQ